MSRAYKARRRGSAHPNRETLRTPRSKAAKADERARQKRRAEKRRP